VAPRVQLSIIGDDRRLVLRANRPLPGHLSVPNKSPLYPRAVQLSEVAAPSAHARGNRLLTRLSPSEDDGSLLAT
jgi:hypothetical protein